MPALELVMFEMRCVTKAFGATPMRTDPKGVKRRHGLSTPAGMSSHVTRKMAVPAKAL
jgi:hypothetical protein